ncbi:G-patch domain and KOW motifs-containing protein [Ostrinia furnacalis]|uniref:G-patch domain and KOW motifs-containing protein n=1 Tax=Ostrinia furnacalis TaxID=93504 RepID=UPI0010399A84|nr:G-patch domain and KOW motifs-containing protein [Ostrinia furnacalis]
MEGKKISFGFLKTKKVEKPVVEEKREFIECMEEKSIKVVGGEEVKEAAPLIIPMKPNTLVTAERLKQIANEVESALIETDNTDKPPVIAAEQIKTENETLDQMAVRELLEEAKKEVKVETNDLTVPVSKKPGVEVQKESTLEDYEDVPIQEFGLAMLRGMGWTPSKEQSKYKQPQLRPKGLGLGADKVITDKQKKKAAVNEKGEELSIVKNSFVKITTGKYSGYYGKVVSLDEDNGRIMVDITMKKETVSLSEFMMHPVTKAEFDKESKVINADSFDEYKKTEKLSQKSSKNDFKASDEKPRSQDRVEPSSSGKDSRADRNRSNNSSKAEHSNSSGGQRERSRRESSSSEEKAYRRKKSKKRYSSNDSLSSLSDSDKKQKHKSSRRRYSSSDSDSDSPKREKRKRTPEKKRDIDKKRKGKKKKRDRDRSPHHYKKHRK